MRKKQGRKKAKEKKKGKKKEMEKEKWGEGKAWKKKNEIIQLVKGQMGHFLSGLHTCHAIPSLAISLPDNPSVTSAI